MRNCVARLWRTSIEGEGMNRWPVYCKDARGVIRRSVFGLVIMASMTVLRFASLVALTLWVGGLAALGLVVAPSLFSVLTAHDPEGGRTLAGLAFGTIFESYLRLSLGLGAIVACTLGWRAARRRERGLVWRFGVLASMLGATVLTASVIGPRIDAIRMSTPTPIADLADTNPVKMEFGRLHGLSGVLMAGTIAGGLILLWREMFDA